MFQDQELMVKGQKLTNMDPTFYQQQKTQKQPNGAIAKTDSLMNSLKILNDSHINLDAISKLRK